jgi:hypothetical protein
MIVQVECPACKQIADIPFKRSFRIDIENHYIGSGEYIPQIENVYFTCTGCKAETPIEWERDN